MSLSPLLDPFHIGLVPEVIFIPWFPEPLPLAPSFAGPAAIGGQTEKLASGIMNVRCEENFAAAALASVSLGTHRAQNEKKTKATDQSKSGDQRKKKPKKEENFSARISKKINPKKTQFQTGGFPPLPFRR
jgi:hypothetical protein